MKQSSGEMSREDAKVCLRFRCGLKDGVVTARSRAPDAAQRHFDDALQSRGPRGREQTVRVGSPYPASSVTIRATTRSRRTKWCQTAAIT